MPSLYLGPVWFFNFQGLSPFATNPFPNTFELNHSISFHLISDIVSLVMTLATLCRQQKLWFWLVEVSLWLPKRRLVRSTSPYHNWLWWFNALLVLEVRMTQWWRWIWLIRFAFFFFEVFGMSWPTNSQLETVSFIDCSFFLVTIYMCDELFEFLLVFSSKDDV